MKTYGTGRFAERILKDEKSMIMMEFGCDVREIHDLLIRLFVVGGWEKQGIIRSLRRRSDDYSMNRGTGWRSSGVTRQWIVVPRD